MKNIYFLSLLIFLITDFCNAQNFERRWASLYTDSNEYTVPVDYTVVDVNGNSYVAGYKSYRKDSGRNSYDYVHMFLLKVNNRGTQEWIRYFDNKNDSSDTPSGLALDTSGKIYITVVRTDIVCNTCSSKISDIVTMEYDAAGDLLWLNRYHDSIYILAKPTGMAISENGSVVVTGSDGSLGFVEKINKNGKTVWLKKMNDNVVFNTACFDQEDNIIVAGASDSNHIYHTDKPMVMKLSAKGHVLWSKTFKEHRKYGHLYFVQCDSVNNIYANGQTDTIDYYNAKIITIKYNARGQQQWFRKEGNGSYIITAGYEGDFAVDAAGNSYITGFANPAGSADWLTTKYDNTGARQWITYYDDTLHAQDQPLALALGKDGIAYVTGFSRTTTGNSLLTVVYNNSGDSIASFTYIPAPRSRYEGGTGRGIGLDKKGNFYVSSEFYFHRRPEIIGVFKYGMEKTLPGIAKSSYKTLYDFQIYPNPAANMLNIIFKTSALLKNYYCTITNINGYEVLHDKLTETGSIINTRFDINGLQAGIYKINISNGANTISKTFIKK